MMDDGELVNHIEELETELAETDTLEGAKIRNQLSTAIEEAKGRGYETLEGMKQSL